MGVFLCTLYLQFKMMIWDELYLSDMEWEDFLKWEKKQKQEKQRKILNDFNDKDLSLEHLLDDHPKLLRRLDGRDIFHGRSLRNVVVNRFDVTNRNPVLKVDHRPMNERSVYVTLIDKQTNIIDSHDKPLSKRETWDTMMDMLLDNGKISGVEERYQNQRQFRAVFSVDAEEVVIEAHGSCVSDSVNRRMTWFRWGGKYYNPSYLYTLKHGKEFQFEIWKKDSSDDYSDRNVLLARVYSSKHAPIMKRYEIGWRQVQSVTSITCVGESPIVKEFPREYYQFKRKVYKKKQARCKKTRGTSLSIVINPDQLGFVKTFRVSYFNNAIRQWVCIGNIEGNVDAKTIHTIDLREYAIVTSRMRIEPLEIFGSGQFELTIQGDATIETAEKVQQYVNYELEVPLSTEQNKYVPKRNNKFNWRNIEMKHGTWKKFNSKRRGKLYQYMVSQAKNL